MNIWQEKRSMRHRLHIIREPPVNQLEEYIKELNEFSGTRYKGQNLAINDKTFHKLQIVFPPTDLTIKQEDQLSYALGYAQQLGIEIEILRLE